MMQPKRERRDIPMKYLMRLLCILSMFTLLIGLVSANERAPNGPTGLDRGDDQRLQVKLAINTTAYAGNITEINFTAWSITRTWQGYFGEVRGTIVLADSNNYTMYDWNNADPDGRIYAARTANVNWTSIACANYSSKLSESEAIFTGTNETNRDAEWPMDRPNATFVTSINSGVSQYANYSTFWVGSVQINGTFNSTGGNELTQCYSTVMHNWTGWVDNDQNAGNDMNRFREVVLADDYGNGNIVYTAILEDDYKGFDNVTHDFQMIVGEDGHGTDTATSNYYFYVELE